MKAELIAVGTEILTGQIVNTNAQFLSEKCAELGIDVYFHTAVGDNANRLLSVLEIARQRSDLVILCGGLGPTEDDLTKQTLATFLGKDLIFDEQAMAKLDRFFASRPGRVRTPNNERQAQIVAGSQPLQNPTGLAVGGLIEQAGVTYVVLPGPPSELKAMFTESLQPLLGQSSQRLYSRVLRFFGIGESQLVTLLADLIDQQTDPTLAPYAKTGEVTLRLSTKAASQDEATAKLDQLETEIVQRESLSDYLYGYGEDNSLEKVVAAGLAEQDLSLAIVENMTAGLVQAELTAALQGRQFYRGGRIDPTAQASRDAAAELAMGERQNRQADLGLAVLVAMKPESQVDNALVTLYLSLARAEGLVEEVVELGGYSWQHLRQIVSLQALNFVRKTLSNSKSLL
ncbi:TPA: competence/damage-inducible protein A [Streptococcus suis]|nr:competence/damage-inducible protein A [Streptococcus suis]